MLASVFSLQMQLTVIWGGWGGVLRCSKKLKHFGPLMDIVINWFLWHTQCFWDKN